MYQVESTRLRSFLNDAICDTRGKTRVRVDRAEAAASSSRPLSSPPTLPMMWASFESYARALSHPPRGTGGSTGGEGGGAPGGEPAPRL